ncbi:hypothetical protein CCH79_00002086 [Gambusia affinis]|uniref:Uncharacterized protein n=1 Tax=Gambusia affinis TaxID=33528 RepID=A0A315VI45_GAMAF|nr:hypothetical protein CCH79_00002086 [Gambusia affinis]
MSRHAKSVLPAHVFVSRPRETVDTTGRAKRPFAPPTAERWLSHSCGEQMLGGYRHGPSGTIVSQQWCKLVCFDRAGSKPSASDEKLPHTWIIPGLPDYGFYSAPSDQRGGPCSFADYGSLGPQAAQMLHSEHATSACNSPLQHLHSPDQFKNPGANPSRPGGFPGANSPGPVADLYGPSNQDSAVGNYISAASPQPGSGFGPSITHCVKLKTHNLGIPLLQEKRVYLVARDRQDGVSNWLCVQVMIIQLQALQRHRWLNERKAGTM